MAVVAVVGGKALMEQLFVVVEGDMQGLLLIAVVEGGRLMMKQLLVEVEQGTQMRLAEVEQKKQRRELLKVVVMGKRLEVQHLTVVEVVERLWKSG